MTDKMNFNMVRIARTSFLFFTIIGPQT